MVQIAPTTFEALRRDRAQLPDHRPRFASYGAHIRTFKEDDTLKPRPFGIALATRFAGLDVVDLIGTTLYGKDGIKCVSWLTSIDDSLLEQLGGREVVRHRFGKEILCHDLPHGLVVQAGPAPVLGDANRLDELTYYRHVAAVLKPIYSITLDGMDGLWDTTREMTTAWRRRFFEGARWP